MARRDEPLAFLDEHERETFEEVAVAQTAPVLAAYRRAVYPASVATDRAFVAAVRERYAVARPNAPSLRAFAGPAAIACGRDDHWVGFEDAIRIARLLPRSSMHVLADCGHLLMLEEPARFAALVEDWLDRALAEPPAAPSAR